MTPLVALHIPLKRSLTGIRAAIEASLGAQTMTRESYVQYLSDQAYMVHDVCRQMFLVASHLSLAKRRRLRRFLIDFGLEEEAHHQIAKADIRHLGMEAQPPSLDARLWFLHCRALADEAPLRRIGISIVLENSGAEIGALVKTILAKASFLDATTTRFVRDHLHEDVPHGQKLLDALSEGSWSQAEINDLTSGIDDAGVMLSRVIVSSFLRTQSSCPV
jgi:hypothetical protein